MTAEPTEAGEDVGEVTPSRAVAEFSCSILDSVGVVDCGGVKRAEGGIVLKRFAGGDQ